MDSYIFLQHYWWLIISLLAGLLVFLLFVQGGQTLIYTLGKTPRQRDVIINSLGHKWELTFTTLVTFGGAFFASFPLFYSTSFGGAFYVWMAILFFFVIQAVAYEYRSKPENFLGARTYEWFLILNGLFGTLLLGAAVGTLFTGGAFTVDRGNLALVSGSPVISQWQTPWRGLEALLDLRNVALGLAVFFLARTLGIHYLYNNLDAPDILRNAKRPLWISSVAFVVCFVGFLVSLLLSSGQQADPVTGTIRPVEYLYFHNLREMPFIAVLLALGIAAVLWGIASALLQTDRKAIWFSGTGTVLTVCMLMLLAGYNGTAYYPSLCDPQSSLTIANSSSSPFTLRTMAIVSVFIPFVVAYIWYVWRTMNKKPLSEAELEKPETPKY